MKQEVRLYIKNISLDLDILSLWSQLIQQFLLWRKVMLHFFSFHRLPNIDFSSIINLLFSILIQHSNSLYSLQIVKYNPHLVGPPPPKFLVKVRIIIDRFIIIAFSSLIFLLITLLEYENKFTSANTSTKAQHFH